MRFPKYISKAMTPVMTLFQKQHQLPFKQGYDNLRSARRKSVAYSDMAQSDRCLHRNQSAVYISHNIPSNIIATIFIEYYNMIFLNRKHLHVSLRFLLSLSIYINWNIKLFSIIMFETIISNYEYSG